MDGTHARASQPDWIVAFVGPNIGGEWPWWVYRRGAYGWALAGLARTLRAAKRLVELREDEPTVSGVDFPT